MEALSNIKKPKCNRSIFTTQFYRVHKSYIVSLDNIREIKTKNGNVYHAITHNAQEVPVGRKAFKEIQSKFHLLDS